jgi:hypothetical protein
LIRWLHDPLLLFVQLTYTYTGDVPADRWGEPVGIAQRQVDALNQCDGPHPMPRR